MKRETKFIVSVILAAFVSLAVLSSTGCATVKANANEQSLVYSAEKLIYAEVSALGALNKAGKLTPDQYDRALVLSKQAGLAVRYILDAPDADHTEKLGQLKDSAEGLAMLMKEVSGL